MAGLASAGVGIIANPASSKDIRRVVAHATIVPNHEKVSIVRRALLGLAATPVRQVWYLPDRAGLVRGAADRLSLPFALTPLVGDWQDQASDSAEAARQLAELGAGCLITLGGDGTARAAVKGSRAVPLLALSTGTNNAFPVMLEGTLAGMAAGALATIAPEATRWEPILEIWRGDQLVDVALVDVAAFEGDVGSRAVWEMERVPRLVTTRLRPGT
ncbi:MAG TPA: NAD(+)/NADH kinase, partial [Herpetosiphonaceae bacterium]